MSRPKQNILVVRNDKLGDFMLAGPAMATLRASMPAAKISVLVPQYTADIARALPFIDAIIIDKGESAWRLAKDLKAENYSAIICLFSTPRVALAAFLARIPVRVAPATQWQQLLFNQTSKQGRSQSLKPEYEYNIDLVAAFLKLNDQAMQQATAPFWPLSDTLKQDQRAKLAALYGFDASHQIIIIHPGSGGSAVNLSLAQYQTIATAILDQSNTVILLSAGPGEQAIAEQLHRMIDSTSCFVYPSPSIIEFAHSIHGANLFIAGSTGPLHIAGLLNAKTAGFYPNRRSATSLRWQTCNQSQRRLGFSPPAQAEERDMASIDAHAAAAEIIQQLI